jgi:tripartite-type tricarboxylate transporter receptor subunit TctC
MEAAIRACLSDPANAKRLQETQQMTLKLGGPKEMDAFLMSEVKRWGQVVRENNIRP